MTAEPADAGRSGNLMQAPPGDPGSHGRFDARSSPRVAALSGDAVRLLLAVDGFSLAFTVVTAIRRPSLRR